MENIFLKKKAKYIILVCNCNTVHKKIHYKQKMISKSNILRALLLLLFFLIFFFCKYEECLLVVLVLFVPILILPCLHFFSCSHLFIHKSLEFLRLIRWRHCAWNWITRGLLQGFFHELPPNPICRARHWFWTKLHCIWRNRGLVLQQLCVFV